MGHRFSKKCQTTKLLEDNIGENLDDCGLVVNFKIQQQKQDPR